MPYRGASTIPAIESSAVAPDSRRVSRGGSGDRSRTSACEPSLDRGGRRRSRRATQPSKLRARRSRYARDCAMLHDDRHVRPTRSAVVRPAPPRGGGARRDRRQACCLLVCTPFPPAAWPRRVQRGDGARLLLHRAGEGRVWGSLSLSAEAGEEARALWSCRGDRRAVACLAAARSPCAGPRPKLSRGSLASGESASSRGLPPWAVDCRSSAFQLRPSRTLARQVAA